MNKKPKVVSITGSSSFRLDPTLTSEETIILRTLAAGQTDRQVCNQLDMNPTLFLRMMRDMRDKIGTSDNVSLIAWAKRQMIGLDQRIASPEGDARRSSFIAKQGLPAEARSLRPGLVRGTLPKVGHARRA
jgi:DNA-binding CsgD family transcriptional regulator